MRGISIHKEDIAKYNLPNDPTALKKTDTRAKKFLKEYGNYSVELDALSPVLLEQKIKTAIESELNISLFNEEVKKCNIEFDLLNKLKKSVIDFIK